MWKNWRHPGHVGGVPGEQRCRGETLTTYEQASGASVVSRAPTLAQVRDPGMGEHSFNSWMLSLSNKNIPCQIPDCSPELAGRARRCPPV